MTKQYHPLQGRQLSLGGTQPLMIRAGIETSRFNLRIDPASLSAASQVFGLALPETIGGLALSSEPEGQGKSAIMIGPDEWYLTAPIAQYNQIIADFAKFYETQLHSLVDISNREISIVVEGTQSAYLLQALIAFDVENMAVASGRRTILDRVQIILMREQQDRFRIELWASFAEHVWQLLDSVFNEIKAETTI